MSNLYPLIVPLAPLIAALFTALPHRCLSDRNYKIGWWITFAGFVTALLLLWQAIQSPEPTRVTLFALPLEILPVLELSIDRLSAVMMVVISGFGTLLYRYSIRYLQQDYGHGRYQTLLVLAVSSLLFMVSSADLVMLFIFWQVLSWFLCLLSHNYAHVPTAQSSFRTFIMLRAGDLAFMGGITLAYHLYGTVQFAELFEAAVASQAKLALFGMDISGVTVVTLLIFVGAMSKSAQFPLHMWLPDSLYAPTPIHALLHAGIINAGGFLLTRLAPLYVLSPVTLHVVMVIGLATAVLGTCMMLVQNDIKKTLGYSTIGQMGYMIMECGLGAFSLAVFHLIAHGLFKADIFLNCGKGIHEARLEPASPPQPAEKSGNAFGWISALVLSFLITLAITVGVHNVLGIHFLDSQGHLILLLFSWATASQAMLTLLRLKKRFFAKSGMLIAIGVIATAYFFAAERFTHFLIPNPTVVESYFHAAELPYSWFLILAGLLVLSIVLGWFFSVYRQQNDGRAPLDEGLKRKAYLFFMNRLYLDGVALRLWGTFKRIGKGLNTSPFALIVVAAIGLFMAYRQMAGMPEVPTKTLVFLLASALLVPLFPLHGLYVTALTKVPRPLSTVLFVVLPMLGVYMMTALLPEIPKSLLPPISMLAIFGALWGSIKALLQVRVSHLLSYGGFALYSVFWWYIAQSGKMTPDALLYAWTVTLVWGALFLAWDRVRVRYGDLDLNQIGGLFQPMPYFAVCMGFLVMAAVGLPPFGLFFGYLGILLSPSTGISFGLMAIIITWFAACWYMFKMMQRLLFGTHREDIRYEDLRPGEIVVFALVIVLLVMSSGIPQDWLSTASTELALKTEVMP